MTTTFDGYTDAFASNKGNASMEESNIRKLHRKCRKLKNENKALKKENEDLKQTIKEQRAAEERAAEEAKKKEKSLFEKVKDAVVKAIPAILSTIASFFARDWFSRKKECKA